MAAPVCPFMDFHLQDDDSFPIPWCMEKNTFCTAKCYRENVMAQLDAETRKLCAQLAYEAVTNALRSEVK